MAKIKRLKANQTIKPIRGKLPSHFEEACVAIGLTLEMDALNGKMLVTDHWNGASPIYPTRADLNRYGLRFRQHVVIASSDPKRLPGHWNMEVKTWPTWALGAAARHKVNRFERYIRGCRKLTDADAPTPEDLLIKAFGAEDTPLNRELGDLLLRAMVTRGLLIDAGRPEGKFDYMPVFVSPGQGQGKSTAFSALFPADLEPTLVSENVQLLVEDDYAFGRSVRGRVLGIVDEMPATRKTTGRMKARITRRQDPIRDLYSRDELDWPRTCVLIATCNDEGRGVLPVDASGHRRYPVVHVPRDSDLDTALQFFRRWRAHLWATALDRVETDKRPLVLSADAAADAERLAAAAEYTPEREAVDALARSKAPSADYATFGDLRKALLDTEMAPERTDNATLSRIFRQAGWDPPKDRHRSPMWTRRRDDDP